ncbi:MAG: hypothetical protein KF761_13430 [Salinibacterium sp.]|nr:hypothetical protein [Salinibacterium sp.]
MTWPGAWPSHILATSRQRLAELQLEVDSLPSDVSVATEQAMTRFLVVRACGHIEFTFDEAFCSYAESKSSPPIAAFVRSQFFRGSNPSAERIEVGLRKLDPARADRFVLLIDAEDQKVRRELGFLVDRRNKIAHGQSESVARRKALDLADIALSLGDWVMTELDPR